MTSWMVFVSVMATFLAVKAQVDSPGQCDTITSTIATNFDFTQAHGMWYEQSTFNQINLKCFNHNMSTDALGQMEVFTQYVNLDDGKLYLDDGVLVYADASGDGKFEVNYGVAGFHPYWVLGTDYTSYAVTWGCVQKTPGQTTQESGVLTREINPSAATLAAVQAVLDANPGLNQNSYRTVTHTNCPIYP
ncbi:hypothetical protein B566_EDAN014343 [Ephemera danica]|nr:hypothetical protein B566_EDAN014343 [Ephemera danica]